MNAVLSKLIGRLEDPRLSQTKVIPWACPVPSFGDFENSMIATLGLNPSNREFEDKSKNKLDETLGRLHTLKSLGLTRWSDAKASHMGQIVKSCRRYFSQQPYDWFKSLDYIISDTGASYYPPLLNACHLDLIPFATHCKWNDLSPLQRSVLFDLAGDTLGLLLRDSSIRILVLNGTSVVESLERIAEIKLLKEEMPTWAISRRARNGEVGTKKMVAGFAFKGTVQQIQGIGLKRPIIALGFNYFISNTPGMTREVKTAIKCWIGEAAKEAIS
jgi:hypothetical protein